MSVSSYLSTIAPQFNSRANRNDFINLASLQVNDEFFGDNKDWAKAYLSAHIMTVTPDATTTAIESGGVVASKREGDLSVSYANLGMLLEDEDLSRTTYGKQFMNLCKQGNAFIATTGGYGYVS